MLDQNKQGLFPLVPLMDGDARREVIEEVITRFMPAHDTITKERIALTRLFASLAFDKDDVENQEWIDRRFAMLQDISSGIPTSISMMCRKDRNKGVSKSVRLVYKPSANYYRLSYRPISQLSSV
jgi:hypothetical protein